MKNKIHIIYVPGVGDDDVPAQELAVKYWNWLGVNAETFQFYWSGKRPWEESYRLLLARIDALHAQGEVIGLVGASAGGSAVINAYAARTDKIIGVVVIAGKINNPDNLGAKYSVRNPNLLPAFKQCEDSLKQLTDKDRSKILSRYAFYDEIVAKADSIIPGARNSTSPTIEHAFTIAFQLLFGAPSLLRFLKKLAKAQ